MKIYGKPIGPKHPVYVIAELSANHANKLEHAIQTLPGTEEIYTICTKKRTRHGNGMSRS